MKHSKSAVVREGYNQIARAYLTERKKLKTSKYTAELMKLLHPGALVLDIGCGAGVPVDDVLMKNGFGVVGIDISPEQIRLARSMCRGGDYSVRDLNTLRHGELVVDAVVCLYTMFHVERIRHNDIVRVFASYLPPGGYLLITFGDKNFEGDHMLMGAPMWSSQWGVEKNTSIVVKAGFDIIINEINTSGGERHQVVLARKK